MEEVTRLFSIWLFRRGGGYCNFYILPRTLPPPSITTTPPPPNTTTTAPPRRPLQAHQAHAHALGEAYPSPTITGAITWARKGYAFFAWEGMGWSIIGVLCQSLTVSPTSLALCVFGITFHSELYSIQWHIGSIPFAVQYPINL